ncbi:hypothetical protein BGX20_006798, partial [Mortierella sp. AD010]
MEKEDNTTSSLQRSSSTNSKSSDIARKNDCQKIEFDENPQKMELDTPPKSELETIDNGSGGSGDIERQDKEGGGKDLEAIIGKKAAIMLFIGLAMASFLASLDGTIIATALPRIASDFRAQSEMSWVATAYLLTF